ncbi:igLON family member 5-like isoform X3 [Anarhichas minor]|uniref:igLON family member 5-like isoform X3 n=1 Tax=Anarhichas minor TaxID=65739 RepID=UPI003F739B60
MCSCVLCCKDCILSCVLMLTMERLILIILVTVPGVLSGDWRVTYGDQCALKGTSVVIKCEYDYPWGHIVTAVSWSKAQYVAGEWKKLLLSQLASPPNHFRYVGNYRGDCSQTVNDVQHTDEGDYFFSFVTTLNRWERPTPAHLSVRELTSAVQPSTVTEGGNVSLTCVTGCLAPINIVWFRDGQTVPNPVFQAEREHAGRYYCAVLGQETARSASVALNVQYRPENISISMDPPHVVEGSSVNLTCSSAANPAADNYTWYSSAGSNFSSLLQVGSGQVLSLPSVEASHTGLYLCQASNRLGENNSTEVLLAMKKKGRGRHSLTILAGIGVSVFVTSLLWLWLKQRSHAKKKAPASYEDEVCYSTVTITPRKPSPPHHVDNSCSKAGENDDSVIYTSLAESS